MGWLGAVEPVLCFLWAGSQAEEEELSAKVTFNWHEQGKTVSSQEWKLYWRRQPGRRLYSRIRTMSRLELLGIMDWMFFNLWGRNTD